MGDIILPMRKDLKPNHFAKPCRGIFTLLTIIFAVIIALPPAHAQEEGQNDHDNLLSYEILADVTAVEAGKPFQLLIKQSIKPQWHTYWINPGDSGNPTTINWQAPDGTRFSDLSFPSPLKIPTGPLVTFGYEGDVLYTLTVTPPAGKTGDNIAISADIEALVCKEICLPDYQTISITLPYENDEVASEPANQDMFARARSLMPEPLDAKAFYESESETFVMQMHADEAFIETMINAGRVYFFPRQWGIIDYTENPKIVQTAADEAVLRFRPDNSRPLSAVDTIDGVLEIKDGDKRTTFSMSARPSEKMESVSGVPGVSGNDGQGSLKSVTLIGAIILAIGGGIILNLMPCVFPVLSLKALSLSKLGQSEQREAALQGFSYTAGIMVTFGAIALLLFALKAGGSEIGWGFQFQNHFVVLALSYLLFVIGLNLAGLFDIPSGFAGVGQSLTQKQGHTGSFMTGMLATIVATPCTAPFMGTAVGFAVTQPPLVGTLVFLSLGLGLALPYLALCFIPRLRAAMPRPGPWMDTFKQFLAFPMFGFTVWLVWIFSIQTGSYGVMVALGGMTAIAFVIWLWQHRPAGRIGKIATTLCALGVIAAIAFSSITVTPVNAPATQQQVADKHPDGSWIYTEATLERLLKTDHPVFVNMTASWCITCKVNERVALSTDSVKEVFKDYNVQYVKGDWTNYDPEITRYLEKYGRSGVPIYIFYGARNDATGKRPEPVILPQILRPGIVKETITADQV